MKILDSQQQTEAVTLEFSVTVTGEEADFARAAMTRTSSEERWEKAARRFSRQSPQEREQVYDPAPWEGMTVLWITALSRASSWPIALSVSLPIIAVIILLLSRRR
jgi:hypothetical protein